MKANAAGAIWLLDMQIDCKLYFEAIVTAAVGIALALSNYLPGKH